MTELIKSIKSQSATLIITLALFGFGLQFAQSWNPPSTTPPGANTAAPITVTGNQAKSGSLSLTGPEGRLIVEDSVQAPRVCIGNDCRTEWPGGLSLSTSTQSFIISGYDVRYGAGNHDFNHVGLVEIEYKLCTHQPGYGWIGYTFALNGGTVSNTNALVNNQVAYCPSFTHFYTSNGNFTATLSSWPNTWGAQVVVKKYSPVN